MKRLTLENSRSSDPHKHIAKNHQDSADMIITGKKLRLKRIQKTCCEVDDEVEEDT